ncbi:glycoside hydrolase family 81 protein [Hypoxylon sp. FL1150]|nr:glycoside hydrolase family 81 protein [Hypoxylon sp. FL1150]
MLLSWALTLLQATPILTARLDTLRARVRSSRQDILTERDTFLESYSPISQTRGPQRETHSSAVVITSSSATAVPSSVPQLATASTVATTLQTSDSPGTATLQPLSSSALSTAAVTSGLETNVSTTSTMAPSNIFSAPISSGAPPSIFKVQKDHPVPRKGIRGPAPISTNKFYANFFLKNQTTPAYVHPYTLTWARGQGSSSSWGMAISHTEADQLVYGDKSPDTNAARYFLNPVGIHSLALSATEFGQQTALTTDNLSSQSVNVNLHLNASTNPGITFPLVQGMGFVTAVYKGVTPLIETGVFFKTVTKSMKGPKQGMTKYTFYLEDGKEWHVYAYSAKGDTFDLTVVNNKMAQAAKPFDGIVQIAKDPGNGAETVIDAASGTYPIGVTLSGSVAGTQGTYTFTFQKGGFANVKPLMYALPHHVDSFDSATNQSISVAKLRTTTKGMATGVVADSWTMVEPQMPTTLGFTPWDRVYGEKKTLKDMQISTIMPVAVNESTQDVDMQSNQNSMYFSGKALAKFALISLAAKELLKNNSMAEDGRKKLEVAFSRFAQNRQQFPLYYDAAWGGLVSSATYITGNDGEDFGNTYYNDHHFHYGYFIHAAAIIGHLNPTWLKTQSNVDFVNSLVRDIANPSPSDKYFPVSRNFDWYHGHSWAHGLYETADGKDQESSSEDAMHAYAIKMWGKTIGDANMEARGNLMLAIIARSLSSYYLYQDTNEVQPQKFVGNRVAGILFENKCDHTTYFGTNIEYIQGIHMIPLIPSTVLTRPDKFVKEEWATYFNNGRVDNVAGGWRGILYGNLATIDPKTAWSFFTQKNFDPSWLDGGASRTWYLAYCAGEFSLVCFPRREEF